MKEIEITVKCYNSLDEADKILKSKGFKIKESYQLNDIYMKKSTQKLCKRNILKVLSNSILIRDIICVDHENKMLTYKKKEYKNGKVTSEEKFNIKIDDIDNAYKFFLQIGFEKLVDVKSRLTVYEKDDYEICFQNVENLGLLIEVEDKSNYNNVSNEEIIKIKKQMVKEVKKYGLKVSNDYDIKKAYELIKKELL